METKLSFSRLPKSAFGGNSLQGYLVCVTMADLRAKYGPADRDAFVEEEKGYEGDDMSFVSTTGQTVRVYSRWGSPRVGGVCAQDARDFASWLRQEGFEDAGVDIADPDQYLALMAAHAAVEDLLDDGTCDLCEDA